MSNSEDDVDGGGFKGTACTPAGSSCLLTCGEGAQDGAAFNLSSFGALEKVFCTGGTQCSQYGTYHHGSYDDFFTTCGPLMPSVKGCDGAKVAQPVLVRSRCNVSERLRYDHNAATTLPADCCQAIGDFSTRRCEVREQDGALEEGPAARDPILLRHLRWFFGGVFGGGEEGNEEDETVDETQGDAGSGGEPPPPPPSRLVCSFEAADPYSMRVRFEYVCAAEYVAPEGEEDDQSHEYVITLRGPAACHFGLAPPTSPTASVPPLLPAPPLPPSPFPSNPFPPPSPLLPPPSEPPSDLLPPSLAPPAPPPSSPIPPPGSPVEDPSALGARAHDDAPSALLWTVSVVGALTVLALTALVARRLTRRRSHRSQRLRLMRGIQAQAERTLGSQLNSYMDDGPDQILLSSGSTLNLASDACTVSPLQAAPTALTSPLDRDRGVDGSTQASSALLPVTSAATRSLVSSTRNATKWLEDSEL